MSGSLGRACGGRGVAVFDRHGGAPLMMSVRPEVARILAAEAKAAAPVSFGDAAIRRPVRTSARSGRLAFPLRRAASVGGAVRDPARDRG